MASSATSRSGSQNNSERLSSNRTSTAACSDCPQQCWIVPNIPANSVFQCRSLILTSVPLRASYASKRLPPNSLGRGQPALLASSARRPSAITRAHAPELRLLRRFKLRKIPAPFPTRGTSKARRFHPQSARPSPSGLDVRRFSLRCQRALFRSVWLHPARAPTCRDPPHAIPRNSPPCCRSRRGQNKLPAPTTLPFPI